ncbi:MAG TPA: CheR family methyltransferase [Polyangiaceae bacterium]|nr:CheR family methyltransferase [Polyangiaceae bacterium]
MSAELTRACADVLELLEQRHGVGVRGSHVPAWFTARLSRALERLQAVDRVPLSELVLRLQNDAARLSELADVLRVGETCFYRDPAQWDALRARLLPELRADSLRAVSVGCSTGEEAWTLAMLLDDACQSTSRSYRVVGVDRSRPALESAQEAAYPSSVARSLPQEWAQRYLNASGDTVHVNAALRTRVRFVCRDLMGGMPPGSFELIVCKNLLIYFGDDAGSRALELLFHALAPGGALVVARSEVTRVRRLGYAAVQLAPGISVFYGR